MQYYNSTKRIASYGFGAKVVADHETSHCFALNGDIFSPEVNGVSGLIEEYQRTLEVVGLEGPSAKLAPVI